jgi:hypothetical protein
VSDEKLLYELLQENGCSDMSVSECSSDSEINVKISSCCEQSVSSDEEENVSDNSSIQHGIWTKSGSGRRCFPFTAKPGLMLIYETPVTPCFTLSCFIHQKLQN